MIVSVGILAHNEANTIRNLIRDLARQDLLSNDRLSTEIHIVANGCTDATIRVATEALTDSRFQRASITTFCHSISRPGKSNAWNEFIHNLASPNTDLAIVLDADIRIPEETTLQRMLDRLIDTDTAVIAIDESMTDLSLTVNKTMMERLILAATGTAHDSRTAVAGGLYCARFGVLRGIWMPIGLPVEDGFLRAMILTSSFTEKENYARLVFVDGARHIFESYRHIRDIIHHNVRIAIGTEINRLLYDHFHDQLNNKDIGNYIRNRNAADPNWINGLIAAEIGKRKYFVVHKGFVLRRLRRLKKLSTSQQVRTAPIVLLGTAFDLAIFLIANHLLRKGAGAGFW
jgi:glycosyltransferase involved in cell wall biosynthesis